MANARDNGGITGPGQNYVNPVYRNMTPSKAKAVDKAVANLVKGQGLNKGKAADVAKAMKQVQKDIKDVSRVRGRNSTNPGYAPEPKYRGARGGFSGGAGGMFGTKNR